eukprot:gene25798-228_t
MTDRDHRDALTWVGGEKDELRYVSMSLSTVQTAPKQNVPKRQDTLDLSLTTEYVFGTCIGKEPTGMEIVVAAIHHRAYVVVVWIVCRSIYDAKKHVSGVCGNVDLPGASSFTRNEVRFYKYQQHPNLNTKDIDGAKPQALIPKAVKRPNTYNSNLDIAGSRPNVARYELLLDTAESRPSPGSAGSRSNPGSA